MTQTVREAYYEAVQAGTIPNSEESYRIFAAGRASAVQEIVGPQPTPDGPVIVLDMGSFEMGQTPPSRPNLYAEVYQTEPQEPPALRHKDWKPDPIITTLEITDGARDYECDELIIHEDPNGVMEFKVRSRREDHYQTIELPPEYVEIVAAFLMRDCAPAAYLLRQDQRGRLKLRHDRVWKGLESARAAAVRETSANRLMTPVPVYEMPLLALGMVRPGFKAGNPPIQTPRERPAYTLDDEAQDIYATVVGSMAADSNGERVVGKYPALGMGYGTLGEAGQRAYHGLSPEGDKTVPPDMIGDGGRCLNCQGVGKVDIGDPPKQELIECDVCGGRGC